MDCSLSEALRNLYPLDATEVKNISDLDLKKNFFSLTKPDKIIS